MNKALLGVGAGIGAVAIGGTIAWLATRPSAALSDSSARGHDRDANGHGGVPGDRSILETRPAPQGEPAGIEGPSNLAVAWWPQDISVQDEGRDAILRFQSTIANVGGAAAAIRPGDRVVYTVRRADDKTGAPGAIVGRGSVALDRADVEPFPVTAGHGAGRDLAELGKELSPISRLEPATAAIIGSQHATQAIRIDDARAGLYLLEQRIVRADGSTDVSTFDDARVTELLLDGAGGFLHTSSRYAGTAGDRHHHGTD